MVAAEMKEAALELVVAHDGPMHIETVQEVLRHRGFERVDYWGLYGVFEAAGFELETALYNTGHYVSQEDLR